MRLMIMKVAARLFTEDVKILKRQAEKRETDMSTRLRTVVHEALHPRMTIYRFHIGYNEKVTFPKADGVGFLEYTGCLAVAIAKSREAAIELLQEEGAREGVDLRWLSEAKHVAEIPVDCAGRIAWAQ